MDFWRPNYRSEAFVDGHYSTKMYLHALTQSWEHYHSLSKRDFKDHAHHCYHVPIPRLVEKAHLHLADHCGVAYENVKALQDTLTDSLTYSRIIGNCYTAALYLSLVSLLDNNKQDLSGQRIGFYSYGSGCVAEYFSGVVQPQYKSVNDAVYNSNSLEERSALNYNKYEEFYSYQLPTDGSQCVTPVHPSGDFRLAGIDRHQRIYEKV